MTNFDIVTGSAWAANNVTFSTTAHNAQEYASYALYIATEKSNKRTLERTFKSLEKSIHTLIEQMLAA
jgi:hypothetical protein